MDGGSMMILIQHGMVYTMEDAPMLADVLVEDGKILQVAAEIFPQPEWTVIDASGKNVYPGFIDAHCHRA